MSSLVSSFASGDRTDGGGWVGDWMRWMSPHGLLSYSVEKQTGLILSHFFSLFVLRRINLASFISIQWLTFDTPIHVAHVESTCLLARQVLLCLSLTYSPSLHLCILIPVPFALQRIHAYDSEPAPAP